MAGLTLEQARDLVDHFGSTAAAARAVGMSYSSLWSALHPEAQREQNRRAHAKRATAPGWAARHAEAQQRYRERRLAEGMCVNCGREPLLTTNRCWSCLNKQEEARFLAL
jgi:hypothetical protein